MLATSLVGLPRLAGMRALLDASAAVPAQAGVRVEVHVVGDEAEPGRQYAVDVRCTAADGRERGGTTFRLGKGGFGTLTAADLPGLVVTDRCTAQAAPVDGAETTYRTGGLVRDDGSTTDPAPGVLVGGAYRSAPAPADGTTIAVTHTFAGDLVLHAAVVDGTPGTNPLFVFAVRCDPDGSVRTITLGDHQSVTVTGIPSGSTCRVSLPGGTARYSDNSGDPYDATVTIVTTPARCWDLRNADPTCRAVVDASVTARGDEPDGSLRSASSSSSSTSTTSPTTTAAPATTAAPTTAAPAVEAGLSATVAPAVSATPAAEVEATPAFTG